jgi:sarcosine oxidase, subunit beta
VATYEVLIVGGGNLGLWSAYYLAKRGVSRIAVCERYTAGFGATSRSAGVVRQQGGSETAAKLGRWSRELYLELGEELGLDSGFRETGYYIIARDDDEKAAYQELVDLRLRCGVQNEWIEPEEGRRRFPSLNWDRLTGATYTPDDGYVHPPLAARNITIAAVKSEAIELFEGCEVGGIESAGNRFRVRTSRGEFEAERVLNAGGPRGQRQVGEMVGVDIPVRAARHQIITFPALPEGEPHPFPLWFALADGYYVRPEEQGVLLGMSNPEERADSSGRYQIGFDWDFYEKLRPAWEEMWPPLKGLPISRAWAASIDYTPDHLPIIDELLDNYFVLAAGGHGMMWGPALGMKMAEFIDEGTISDLPDDEVRVERFSKERASTDKIALPFPTE